MGVCVLRGIACATINAMLWGHSLGGLLSGISSYGPFMQA